MEAVAEGEGRLEQILVPLMTEIEDAVAVDVGVEGEDRQVEVQRELSEEAGVVEEDEDEDDEVVEHRQHAHQHHPRVDPPLRHFSHDHVGGEDGEKEAVTDDRVHVGGLLLRVASAGEPHEDGRDHAVADADEEGEARALLAQLPHLQQAQPGEEVVHPAHSLLCDGAGVPLVPHTRVHDVVHHVRNDVALHEVEVRGVHPVQPKHGADPQDDEHDSQRLSWAVKNAILELPLLLKPRPHVRVHEKELNALHQIPRGLKVGDTKH
mmetsp:Transcript_54401/g.127190  ORF Transcript_54401/g.127190 Transcript_54401/m.127190 type:complete len:265 (+) Transcript_54401:450-1244(+)